MEDDALIEFFAVAFVAPLIAGVIAFLFARIGNLGKIRQLELFQRRVEVYSFLLDQDTIDDTTRQRIRWELDETVSELLGESGDQLLMQSPGEPSTQAERSPIPSWDSHTVLRRWFFPPFRRSLGGWFSIILYYYFGLVALLFLVVGVFLGAAGDAAGLVGGMILAAFVYGVLMLPISFWIRANYTKDYLIRVESIRAHGSRARHAETEATAV
ncbi:MAG: hypothetical protein AAF689_14500 [Pseudomonadota bacterium]